MNVAMSVGLAFAAILGAYLFVLWYGSATVIDKHEDRITVMEKRWAEQFGGPEPAVELEPDTDQFPVVQPATEPMPLTIAPTPTVRARRNAAWDEQRPSPVPRELMTPEIAEKQRVARAAFVEEQLVKFDFSGRSK